MDSADMQNTNSLWLETPLVFSTFLSARLGCNVYLKLENLQPSQSFKYRGISLFAQKCKETHGPAVHLIAASGGNAGLAAASAARTLGLKCSVYIPEGMDPKVYETLRNYGAHVVMTGKYYLQALQKAQEAVLNEEKAVMVPAYDDPILWDGHASMMDEIRRQLPCKPDAVVCSVGGGGLLGGVLLGCARNGWDDVPVAAMETHGSACFYHTMSLNERGWKNEIPADISTTIDEKYGVVLAHLDKITSRASSLGASSPAAGVVKMATVRDGPVACVTIPDEMAMSTSVAFAEDHKTMIELACATTLAVAYNRELFGRITEGRSAKNVVFIVCGGAKISLVEMEEYRIVSEAARRDRRGEWEVNCNGETWMIPKNHSVEGFQMSML